MSWFHKLFSIEEFRVSSLVLILVAVVGVILVSFYLTGMVNPLLVNLAETLVYSIAGVNLVSGISSVFNRNSLTNDLLQNNSYQSYPTSNSSVSYSNVDRSSENDSGIMPKI